MKRIYIPFQVVVMLALMAFAPGKKYNYSTFSVKQLDKHLCHVKDKLYAHAYELGNSEYRLFISEMKKTNADWKQLLPDTAKWNMDDEFNDPYVDNYFRHPAYAMYPVNNLNKEQAIAYCNWLSELYNKADKRKFKKVNFRLPTEAEWELAAKGGMELVDYPHGSYYLRNSKGRILYNYLRVGEGAITRNAKTGELEVVTNATNTGTTFIEAASITAPIDAYWPNNFGLYNMSGNVAEMVQEEGIAKGGSFRDPGYDIRIQSVKKYNEPSPLIGFRVFMEVIEE